jgi:hypothetical protein
MPELHANQIRWEAPEPQKVAFDKPNYQPLADAFNTLGRAAKEFSDYQNKIDDINAKALMDQAADEALVELEKQNPSDNDYSRSLNEFNNKLNATFGSFDGATQTRFGRSYPEYMAEQRLKAEALVFDKQQKFAIEKAKNTLPLLASNVVEGVEPYEKTRKDVENMVANMDNVTAEEMLYTFDSMIQNGKINNLIYSGRYQDAITLLENPVESDTFSPDERTQKKLLIQRLAEEEVRTREAAKKQATKDINDALEDGLVSTLLYALDKKDDSYGRVVQLFDDPNSKIPISDDKGKVVEYITAKDIPVMVRREALKKARQYEADSMSYRVNELRAEELADNFEKQYKLSQGKRDTGEVFNNIYAFTRSPDFIYLSKEKQGKMTDIVYGQINRTIEQVKPYTNFRNDRQLYGLALTGMQSYDSPLKIVSDYIFEPNKAPEEATPTQKIVGTLVAGSPIRPLVPLKYDPRSMNNDEFYANQQRGFRQATSVLRDEEEKVSGKPVGYGSALEYIMNQYVELIGETPEGRKNLGVEGVTDEQISLAYNYMKGVLEAQGTRDILVGGDGNKDKRKELFNGFYDILNGGHTPSLTPEQSIYKARFFDTLARATVGTGGKPLSFTPTEQSMVDEENSYPRPLTNDFYNENKAFKKRYEVE